MYAQGSLPNKFPSKVVKHSHKSAKKGQNQVGLGFRICSHTGGPPSLCTIFYICCLTASLCSLCQKRFMWPRIVGLYVFNAQRASMPPPGVRNVSCGFLSACRLRPWTTPERETVILHSGRPLIATTTGCASNL